MANGFRRATKEQSKLRLSLQGPSGAGKTYSALSIARGLVGPKGSIAVIDTEKGSASKYAGQFEFDVDDDFGMGAKANFHPDRFVEKLNVAVSAGFDCVILDSATHLWNGEGGFLAVVDAEVQKMRAKGQKADSFAAWKNVTPIYNRFVHAILRAPLHVIVCLRSKTEYEKTEGGDGKKGGLRKIGMAAEFRDGFEYEMDIQGVLSAEHYLTFGKHRLGSLLEEKIFKNPAQEFADACLEWLNSGVAPRTEMTSVPEQRGAMPRPAGPAIVSGSQRNEEDCDVSNDSIELSRLKIDMLNATSLEVLKAVAKEASESLKTGKLSKAEYGELPPLYSNRSKDLKALAAQ